MNTLAYHCFVDYTFNTIFVLVSLFLPNTLASLVLFSLHEHTSITDFHTAFTECTILQSLLSSNILASQLSLHEYHVALLLSLNILASLLSSLNTLLASLLSDQPSIIIIITIYDVMIVSPNKELTRTYRISQLDQWKTHAHHTSSWRMLSIAAAPGDVWVRAVYLVALPYCES